VHKEFLPEGKTVNAEFLKEEWITSWSTFIGFVQLHSAPEIFTCCTIVHPPTNLQVFANFWPQKMLQLFVTPYFEVRHPCCVNQIKSVTLQIYLSQTIFCSPSWKWS
jgi:hypothetical protein